MNKMRYFFYFFIHSISQTDIMYKEFSFRYFYIHYYVNLSFIKSTKKNRMNDVHKLQYECATDGNKQKTVAIIDNGDSSYKYRYLFELIGRLHVCNQSWRKTKYVL